MVKTRSRKQRNSKPKGKNPPEAKLSGRTRPLDLGEELTGTMAIVKAVEMSTSVDDEELAVMVRDGFVTLRPQLEEWLPRAIELHARFEARKRAKERSTIMGCRTWAQFCKQILSYSDRQIRRLMEGVNPASKYGNRPEHRSEVNRLAGPTPAGIAATVDRSTDWTADEYVQKCVGFITTTLRPLESDSQLYEHVVQGIAKEILSALGDANRKESYGVY